MANPISFTPISRRTGSVQHVGRDRAIPVTRELVDPRIADVEAVARWFDYAFVLPGGFRFGLAGIIGLVPGIGDLIDALVSLYIVQRAIQLGVPRVTVSRMMLNVAIEAVAGSVPLIGDLFDVAFKANRRNYQLLKRHMSHPRRQQRLDWLFLVGTLLLVAISVALPVWALLMLVRHVM
jgi:hypothetical protein